MKKLKIYFNCLFCYFKKKSEAVLLAVSLYGFNQLLLIKLDEKRTVNLKTESSFDPKLNGCVKEVVI